MKYALIAMAVIYLITFGCSPDEEKKAADSHEKVSQTAVETAAPEARKAPAAVHQEEHAAKTVAEPMEGHAEKAVTEPQENAPADHPPAVTEEAAPAPQPAEGQYAAIAQSAENTVKTLMGKESQPVEKEAVKTEVTENQPAPQIDADKEMITMPCGRVMAQKDIPAGAPCIGYKRQAAAAGSEDLSAAMQKMVEATNNMVQVTRQMVIATQEMLNASKAAEAQAQDSKQQ